MANKSNHFFIEKNHVKFFNNSEKALFNPSLLIPNVLDTFILS